VAQGHLKKAAKRREMIRMCLASGGQNNYKISNETQTTWKTTQKKKKKKKGEKKKKKK